MTANDNSGTTRRGVLKATAGLLGVGATAGCIDSDQASAAMQACMKSSGSDGADDLDEYPTTAYHSRHELQMGISGASASAGDGGAIHTLHIARGSEDVDWFLDTVDMVNYGGPDGAEGVPAYEVNASYLEEGGTTVLLAAENDHGTILSPDAEAFTDILPDDVLDEGVRPHGADW